MRRLAWLFFLPLALCQYQQQQRYNPQQFPNQQQQYGANQQYNQQQQQFGQQNQQNQQMQNRQQQTQQNQQNARYPGQQYPQQGYQQQQGGQFNQQQQQFGQNQQGMNGQMNPNQQQSSRSEVVNTPTRLMSSSGNSTSTYGAQVDIKLNSYSNTDLSLSDKTTCSCPNGRYCDYLSADKQNSCQFSFTTVISAKDQSVQFIQSDFYPFSGSINTGNWTMAMSFVMPTKPVAVDIFVQHLGVVINKLTGQLEYFNHLTLVDSFVVDMTGYIPTQNQNSRQYTLTGLVQKTSLQMALSVQCINGLMGTDCDLRCDSTTNNQFDNVICTDSYGTNSSCRWNTYKTSVSDCMVCNMVGANGTCAVVYNERHDGVSYAFRTWTIVLGCLLGLAVLFILCLIISFIICYRLRNRNDRDETTSTAYKAPVQDSYANGKSSHQPLLEDEWAAVPRRPIMPERTNDRGGYNTREPNTSVSRQEHQV